MNHDWDEVVDFTREILAHGNNQIVQCAIVTGMGQEGKEEQKAADERNWQAMVAAIDKSLNGTLEDANAFDVLVHTAAQILREGRRLPPEFTIFTADVLEGKIRRPTKRGPDPNRDWIRNFALSFATEAVSTKFGIARYESGNTNNRTAANAVGEVAKCTPRTVRNALKSHPLSPSFVAIVVMQLGLK